MSKSLNNTAFLLHDLSVIQIEGADAATFLHSQLTHDIAQLTPGQARLAGYCTAKGRLLASVVVWRGSQADTLFALVKADLAADLVKRLSMFVLRAKAALRITDLPVYGISMARGTNLQTGLTSILGAAAAQLDPGQLPHIPSPYSTTVSTQSTWIAAPSADTGVNRWWVVGETPAAAPENLAPIAHWQAADIAAGLPWVLAATQDTFIPQTLNLDLIDGVSFTKGCYPGQEIVARSHYRGTVKRRMAYGLGHGIAPDASLEGTDIYDAARPASPCGRVINAATAGDYTHFLLEVQLADLESASFRLGSAEGPAIEIQALPYGITA